MRGLSILVTGAGGGLGSLVCEALVEAGAAVIAHDRTDARLAPLRARLGPAVRTEAADLARLADVVALAGRVGPVDVVINNAGVGFGRDQLRREVSADGLELRFAVNYVAAFVLSYALRRGARAIVQVASAGQRALDLDDLETARDYDGIVAYRRSKLAQVMLAIDLAASSACASTALHPGTFLDTPMLAESGITPLAPAREGAEAILAVLARTLDGATGAYFDGRTLTRADPQAYDPAVRAALRAWTLALLARHQIALDVAP